MRANAITDAVLAPPLSRAVATRALEVLDPAAAVAALLAVFALLNLDQAPGGVADFLGMRVTVRNVILLALFAVVWRAVFRLFGLYGPDGVRLSAAAVGRLAAACGVGSLAAALLASASRSGSFTVVGAIALWPTSLAFVVATRALVSALGRSAGSRGRRRPRTVVIVGTGPRARRLYDELRADRLTDYRVLGFVDAPDYPAPDEVRRLTLGDVDRLEHILMTNA